jgi:hypothetical protein
MMPIMMSEKPYAAYLVRIWRDDSRSQWRAQVVPVGAPGGEGRFFTNPAQLLLYWAGEESEDTSPMPILQGDES